METCPKCKKDYLVYDVSTISARCLQMDCLHSKRMDEKQYSKIFARGEKNLANKLSFTHNNIIRTT